MLRDREARKNESLRDRDSTIVILKPRILRALIDCLAKSKSYKRNSKFFLVREVQENFKTALCGAIEKGSFQTHHKNKSLDLRLL